MFTISAHTNWVNSAMFSPDTRLIASGSEDNSVKLWRGESCISRGHSDQVTSVAFGSDGGVLATGSEDSVKTWSTGGGRLPEGWQAAFDESSGKAAKAAAEKVNGMDDLTTQPFICVHNACACPPKKRRSFF